MDKDSGQVWGKWEGQTVDQVFPLQRCLGTGENSGVFLTGLSERRAALKLIPADPKTADLQLSRWQRAARLTHPHLVRILRSGRCQLDGTDFLYVVTEYAEEDLSQVIPARALTTIETLDMLRPTLDALDYLHREGLVHGHVKPSNIMAVDDQLKISSDGVMPVGEKPASAAGPYDAPDETLTPKSDTWSLGLTLVQVLTRRLPVWNKAVSNDAVLPAGLLEQFRGIARDCLKRNPQERPAIGEIGKRLSNSNSEGASRPNLKWTYVAVAVVVAIVGIVLVARRGGSAPSETSVPAAAPPVVQAPADPKPVAKETKIPPPPPRAESPASAGQDAPQDVLEQSLPEVPQNILNTIHGRIRLAVKVQVDASGKVTDAGMEPPGGSKYLSERTLRASKRWKFRPGDAAQEWILHYVFTKDGPTVTARRLSP